MVERVTLVRLIVNDKLRLERAGRTSELDRTHELLTKHKGGLTRLGGVVSELFGVGVLNDLDVEELANLSVIDFLFIGVARHVDPLVVLAQVIGQARANNSDVVTTSKGRSTVLFENARSFVEVFQLHLTVSSSRLSTQVNELSGVRAVGHRGVDGVADLVIQVQRSFLAHTLGFQLKLLDQVSGNASVRNLGNVTVLGERRFHDFERSVGEVSERRTFRQGTYVVHVSFTTAEEPHGHGTCVFRQVELFTKLGENQTVHGVLQEVFVKDLGDA